MLSRTLDFSTRVLTFSFFILVSGAFQYASAQYVSPSSALGTRLPVVFFGDRAADSINPYASESAFPSVRGRYVAWPDMRHASADPDTPEYTSAEIYIKDLSQSSSAPRRITNRSSEKDLITIYDTGQNTILAWLDFQGTNESIYYCIFASANGSCPPQHLFTVQPDEGYDPEFEEYDVEYGIEEIAVSSQGIAWVTSKYNNVTDAASEKVHFFDFARNQLTLLRDAKGYPWYLSLSGSHLSWLEDINDTYADLLLLNTSGLDPGRNPTPKKIAKRLNWRGLSIVSLGNYLVWNESESSLAVCDLSSQEMLPSRNPAAGRPIQRLTAGDTALFFVSSNATGGDLMRYRLTDSAAEKIVTFPTKNTFDNFALLGATDRFIVSSDDRRDWNERLYVYDTQNPPPPPPPPIVSVGVRKAPGSTSPFVSEIKIDPPAQVEIKWQSQNAVSCVATGSWSGDLALSGTRTITINPMDLGEFGNVYGVTCANAVGQTARQSAAVAVATTANLRVQVGNGPIQDPADDAVIEAPYGSNIVLHWTSNTDRCIAGATGGGFRGLRAASGSESVAALTYDRIFSIRCTSLLTGKTVTDRLKVVVSAPPKLSVRADERAALYVEAPPFHNPDNKVINLSWETEHASSCTASGAWSGKKPIAGTAQVGPYTQTSTQQTFDYTLTCRNQAGVTVSSTARIVIKSLSNQPMIDLQVSASENGQYTDGPISVEEGSKVYLRWKGQQLAASCDAAGAWKGSKRIPDGKERSAKLAAKETSFLLSCVATNGTPLVDSVKVFTYPKGSAPGDWRVISMGRSEVQPHIGEEFQIAATIQNGGSSTLPPTTFAALERYVYLGNAYTRVMGAPVVVPSLSPGETATVMATVYAGEGRPNSLSDQLFEVVGVVDILNTVIETDEGNNIRWMSYVTPPRERDQDEIGESITINTISLSSSMRLDVPYKVRVNISNAYPATVDTRSLRWTIRQGLREYGLSANIVCRSHIEPNLIPPGDCNAEIQVTAPRQHSGTGAPLFSAGSATLEVRWPRTGTTVEQRKQATIQLTN